MCVLTVLNGLVIKSKSSLVPYKSKGLEVLICRGAPNDYNEKWLFNYLIIFN